MFMLNKAFAKSRLASVGLIKSSKPDDDDPARIEAMADILGGLFGDDALKFFATPKHEKAWNETDHPRGKNGKFMKRGGSEAVDTAHAKVKEILKGGKTAETHKQLIDHLSILTTKQLHQLKQKFQLSAGGENKEALRNKIAERLGKGRVGDDTPEPAGEVSTYAEWGKQERESRKKPAPAEPAPVSSTAKKEPQDPLDVNAGNVRELWERMREEIVNHDPKMSPAMAGSIAAARILNNVGKRADEFIRTIDAKVRNDERITDEEDAKYMEANDARKNLYKPLVDLSGYRPYPDLDNHPLAQRQFDAEPLEDVAAKNAAELAGHKQKQAEVAASLAKQKQAASDKAAAFQEQERQANQERKRQENVNKWHQQNGTLVGVGRRDSLESIGNKKRSAVASALAAGKPVPPEVLADYPDLAAKYGRKEAGKNGDRNEQGQVYHNGEWLTPLKPGQRIIDVPKTPKKKPIPKETATQSPSTPRASEADRKKLEKLEDQRVQLNKQGANSRGSIVSKQRKRADLDERIQRLRQKVSPTKSFRLSKSFAEFRINKDGYTGVITDRAGHRRKYVNGKPVAFDNAAPYTIRTSATEPEGGNRQPKVDQTSEKKKPDKASDEPAKNATGGKPAEAKKEGGVFSKLMSFFGGESKPKESAPAPEPMKREEGKPISQATVKAVAKLHADAPKKGQAAIKAIVNDPAWKGPKGEEGVKAVRKALDDAYAKAELTVNMVPEHLAGAMHEGRIKSAYEGKGISKGKQYMAVRTQQEKAVFGAGSDVPNEDRPKYGAINWAGNLYGAADGYGAGVVILHKDKVKDRMTFTPGNSFGHRDPSMVGGGDDHHVASTGTAAALKAAGIESSNKKLSPGYTEAQIWGDLAFDKDTVKEIRFPASAAYSNHVEWVVDVGKTMGIPVTFFHEKTGKSISYEEAQTEAAKVHKWFKPKQKKKGFGNGKNHSDRGTISRKPGVSRAGRVFRPVGASSR